MSGLSTIAVPLALAAVTLVLFLGLFNMMRGGSPNRSQMLMRWRVGLQAAAITLMMIVIFVKTR